MEAPYTPAAARARPLPAVRRSVRRPALNRVAIHILFVGRPIAGMTRRMSA
jgi:hypothetical protein